MISASILSILCLLLWSRRLFVRRSTAFQCPRSDTYAGGFQLLYGEGRSPDFFDSLGDVRRLTYQENGKAVAGLTFVMRDLGLSRAWYIGNFKVCPASRGRRLGLRVLIRSIPWAYVQCPRMFGLVMGVGKPRYLSILNIMCTFFPVRFIVLPVQDMEDFIKKVPRYANKRFIDRRGLKDIVIDGSKLDIIHLCPDGDHARTTHDLPPSTHFMALLMPGECHPAKPLLVGSIVHFGFARNHDFSWLHSGDL
jgi:hypothetical protein